QEDEAGVRATRRARHDLDLAGVLRRRVDGPLDVELLVGALAREGAQLAQRDLHLPDVEGEVLPIARVHAGVGDLHGRAATARAAHADPLRRLAAVAEGRGAPRADPLVAAVV